MHVLFAESSEGTILSSAPSSYRVVVGMLWPWTMAELLGNMHPQHAVIHTVRAKQTFGLLLGGDIRVQGLAVG